MPNITPEIKEALEYMRIVGRAGRTPTEMALFNKANAALASLTEQPDSGEVAEAVSGLEKLLEYLDNSSSPQSDKEDAKRLRTLIRSATRPDASGLVAALERTLKELWDDRHSHYSEDQFNKEFADEIAALAKYKAEKGVG